MTKSEIIESLRKSLSHVFISGKELRERVAKIS